MPKKLCRDPHIKVLSGVDLELDGGWCLRVKVSNRSVSPITIVSGLLPRPGHVTVTCHEAVTTQAPALPSTPIKVEQFFSLIFPDTYLMLHMTRIA